MCKGIWSCHEMDTGIPDRLTIYVCIHQKSKLYIKTCWSYKHKQVDKIAQTKKKNK